MIGILESDFDVLSSQGRVLLRQFFQNPHIPLLITTYLPTHHIDITILLLIFHNTFYCSPPLFHFHLYFMGQLFLQSKQADSTFISNILFSHYILYSFLMTKELMLAIQYEIFCVHMH